MIDSTTMPGYLKGAEIAIKTLEQMNVELIFAYPGASSIELHQALIDSRIRVVLPRHEQGGAFAAGGYARATGKTGVCMSTSGPGATNFLTAAADAYADSIPLVVITGQVASSHIGTNAFQEVDIIGMSRPIVKHSYLITETEEIAPVIIEAFRLAASGRPGPVWIDIPKNTLARRIEYRTPRKDMDIITESNPTPLPEELKALRSAILAAERPCILAGGGIIASGAAGELRKFAESCDIPVATSLMGIGAFPDDHPLSLKFLGMHGADGANSAIRECDLLLAFGTRFSDRSTGNVAHFAPGAKIIHVDIDASEINKNVHTAMAVVADIKTVLRRLNENPERKNCPEWSRRIAGLKKDFPFSFAREGDELKAQSVISTLSRLAGDRAVIVTGVGQHQIWTAQFYRFSYPRQLLTSGGLGAMGFGLPAAIGAKLALPDRMVVDIDGDGSFQMNIQELGTIAAEGLPVKMMILNNQQLGLVAQMEDLLYEGRRGNTDLRPKPPCFTGIAASYGIPGRDVFRESELEEAISEMLASPGPFLLDCHIEYRDHVASRGKSGHGSPPSGRFRDVSDRGGSANRLDGLKPGQKNGTLEGT